MIITRDNALPEQWTKDTVSAAIAIFKDPTTDSTNPVFIDDGFVEVTNSADTSTISYDLIVTDSITNSQIVIAENETADGTYEIPSTCRARVDSIVIYVTPNYDTTNSQNTVSDAITAIFYGSVHTPSQRRYKASTLLSGH